MDRPEHEKYYGTLEIWLESKIWEILSFGQKALVESLEEIIIRQDILRWAEAWQKLYEGTRRMGLRGRSGFV